MTLEFQEVQDRVLMVQVGRMVFQVFLEPRASLGRYWGPLLEILEGAVHLDSQEIRVYQGRLEALDYLVGRENYCKTDKQKLIISPFLR